MRHKMAIGLAFLLFVTGAADAADGWIRDDWAAAQAEARATGKPIFVNLRCEA